MNSAIRNYLVGYNLVAFIFWSLYLIAFTSCGFKLNKQCLLLLNIAQGLALLEIFHALMRWVKSPFVSTIAQVSSRIFVLVLINYFLRNTLQTVTYIGIVIVSFAWGITEIVRYGHYFLSLLHRELPSVVWMRYSFFILLYPLGITGEWLIIITPFLSEGIALNWYLGMAVFLATSYIYYFPVLYGYMWKQRAKKLG